jgi:hypothetical protein
MRLDPCPNAPYTPGGPGCGECGRSAPITLIELARLHEFGTVAKLDIDRASFKRADEALARLEPVVVSRDGQVVATGVGWSAPAAHPGTAAYCVPRDTKPICKMRINGGNGNPANAHRECECPRPTECKLGGGGDRVAGPEQDVITQRFERA